MSTEAELAEIPTVRQVCTSSKDELLIADPSLTVLSPCPMCLRRDVTCEVGVHNLLGIT